MKRLTLILLVPLVIFFQGCFQDYTVEERIVVSGTLIASAQKQDVAFQFDNVSTFPIFQSRIAAWTTTNPRIEVSNFQRLPTLNVPGSHFEIWGVSASNQVSFGKFQVAGGDLVSFVNGVTGASKCEQTPTGKICTFTKTDPNSPVFTDLDRIQVSIEPPSDQDLIQNGSILLSGFIINQNPGDVEALTFPVSFSQNNITATASMTINAEDAVSGLVALNLTGFPFLSNKFAYQLWSSDSINGFASCGTFNVQNGQIINPDTNQPKGSNIFACGVDLGKRSAMVISLEPTYPGNSSGIFDFRPYASTYVPFDAEASIKPVAQNVRVSVAGRLRDRSLTDVQGKFTVLAGGAGDTYLVVRGLNFQPTFFPIRVIQGQNIGGIRIDLEPKPKGKALFHFFERDFAEAVTSVSVSGSFALFPLALNDSGINGDAIAGDGVWSILTNASSGTITYNFQVNGKTNFNDPHAEKLGDGSSRPTMLIK